MNIEIKLVFCALVVLTSSPQTKAHSPASPHVVTPSALRGEGVSLASPEPSLAAESEDPASPANRPSADQDGAPTEPGVTEGDAPETDAVTDAGDRTDVVTTPRITTPPQPTAPTHTLAPAAPSQDSSSASAVPGSSSSSPPSSWSSAPAEPSSTPGGATYLTTDHLTTSTPRTLNATPPPHDVTTWQPSASPITLTLTPAPVRPSATNRPPTAAPPHAPAGPRPQDAPPELNVGDEDGKVPHHPSSPLDPLLAGLVSVFIVTTAVISVVLFLKFRQRTEHPEFHRLQDLPMDDLMEDTPLSRYTY